MKNRIKNLFLIAASGVFITSCSKDFLNIQPASKYLADPVWSDPTLSESFVTDIYNALHDGLLNQESMDCISDNALYNFGRMDIMEGNISPSNIGWVNNTYEWGEMYTRIRAANIALENLAKAKFDATMVARLQGESHFMRAYCYNQLLRYYGGVPLIKSSYALGADYSIARNTYEECVNFIVSDLDSASQLLTGKSLAAGRATSDAALALKARVLTYAASDLHDIPTAKAKSTLISGYAHPELLGYVSGDRNARWTAALNAAKAVIALGKYGYQYGLAAPVSKDQAITNYTNVYLSRNGGEKEAIFSKYYINAYTDDWGAWYPRNNCTNGYHGWTSTEPTQNLVDSYEYMDSSSATPQAVPFDWTNPVHATTPYVNRDPRFYASIMYDGSRWKPRTTDGVSKDPYGEIQFGTYEVGTAGSATPYFGLDTRNSALENWNGTRTGYAIKKFMDPDPAIVDMNQKQQVPSPQIRYTEVVFNLIEASLALNDEATALSWLNQIRFRAGMPAIPNATTGPALVADYQHERNIEMVCEEQRFYDARRWMIAPSVLGQKVRVMKITGALKPGKTVAIYRYNPNNYTYVYTVQNIESGVENRAWDDKLYFPPIKLDEINKNSKLVQNPGYK